MLSAGERSHTGPDFSYQLTITAPGVVCNDPTDVTQSAMDMVFDVIEGKRFKSIGTSKGDISGDGTVNHVDLFQLTAVWPTLESECKSGE